MKQLKEALISKNTMHRAHVKQGNYYYLVMPYSILFNVFKNIEEWSDRIIWKDGSRLWLLMAKDIKDMRNRLNKPDNSYSVAVIRHKESWFKVYDEVKNTLSKVDGFDDLAKVLDNCKVYTMDESNGDPILTKFVEYYETT